MAIEYTWNFNPLESYTTASGETDVVFNVHWQFCGSTGSYNSTIIGVETVTYQSGSTFIPFNELTKDIVYGWVTASLGQERINFFTASIAQQIAEKINPTILVQQAPWL